MAEKVALMADIKPVAHDIFEGAGFEVVTFPKFKDSLEPNDYPVEVKEALDGAAMIGIRSGPRIRAEVIRTNPDLIAVGCFAVGTNVDFEAANEKGVSVFNAAHANIRSVAEHVIACTLSLLRRTQEHNRQMHEGVWNKTDKQSYEARGKTLGIVGYGNIGSQVSVLAEALNMKVLYADPMTRLGRFGNAEAVSLDELLESADVVTLHVPNIDSTKDMINDHTLGQMKAGAYLINASRGEVVDEEALERALDSGQLGGVALDVFKNEPAKQGDKFQHRLQGRPNVLFTSHVAGSTVEAQNDAGKVVAETLVNYSQTGNPASSVNLPNTIFEMQPPETPRIIYIHDNVPGALREADDILANAGCNIGATGSNIKGEVGLGYFDIESKNLTPGVLEALKNTSTARRVRAIE